MTTSVKLLLSGQRLVRSAVWNVVGAGFPLVIAVLVMPGLVKGLGTERFGLLALIWLGIGYFSLFDMGLGRALTKLVSERLGRGEQQEVPDLVVTALVVVLTLGLCSAGTVIWLSSWLISEVLNIPAQLQSEAEWAFIILGISLPFVMLSTALIGFLEAHQDFKAINVVRIILGSVTFLGPLAVLHWSPSLVAATAVLAVSRVIATVAYAFQCHKMKPSFFFNGRTRKRLMAPLLGFGGWISISNIVGPLMVYLDRFIIGALLTLTAVSFYTIPYEIVTRFFVFPVAIAAVLFPAFTTSLVADHERVFVLFRQAAKILTLAMLPLIALTVLLAPEGLTIWVGDEFARESVGVLRWLAVGVLVNSLARLPHALVQGAGRPDIIAKLHFFELPLYLLGLWILLKEFGIVGAAVAWTIRIGVDAVAFFWLAMRLVPIVRPTCVHSLWLLGVGCAGVAVLALPLGFALKLVIAAVIIGISAQLSYQELVNYRRTGAIKPA